MHHCIPSVAFVGVRDAGCCRGSWISAGKCYCAIEVVRCSDVDAQTYTSTGTQYFDNSADSVTRQMYVLLNSAAA